MKYITTTDTYLTLLLPQIIDQNVYSAIIIELKEALLIRDKKQNNLVIDLGPGVRLSNEAITKALQDFKILAEMINKMVFMTKNIFYAKITLVTLQRNGISDPQVFTSIDQCISYFTR